MLLSWVADSCSNTLSSASLAASTSAWQAAKLANLRRAERDIVQVMLGFFKALAGFQHGWLCINIFNRLAQGLPQHQPGLGPGWLRA